MGEYNKQMQRFNVGEDCPVFDGLYEFCQLSAGGSVASAVKLNKQAADIAINWAGGKIYAILVYKHRSDLATSLRAQIFNSGCLCWLPRF